MASAGKGQFLAEETDGTSSQETELLDQACTGLVERVRDAIRLKHYSIRSRGDLAVRSPLD